MKKYYIVFFTLLLLTGCDASSNNENEVVDKNKISSYLDVSLDNPKINLDNPEIDFIVDEFLEIDLDNPEINLNGNIVNVSVKNLKSKEKINFDDEPSLEIFNDLIINSRRLAGIFNIINPEYKITISLDDGSTKMYNLWLNKDSMYAYIMDFEDSHTLYKSFINLNDILND